MNETKPILYESQQRYWRRRANRRVRKARLTRSAARWFAASVALGIIGTALFQAGEHALERLRSTDDLAVEKIEIDGAERAGPEAIRGRLSGYIGRNIVDLNLYEVAAEAAADPWVLEASAKRILPGTLRVTVVERRPSAVARIDGRFYLVDDTGYIVGPGRFEGLPVLVGLDGLDRGTLVATLNRGADAIEQLRRTAETWVREISEIDLSRQDRIEVFTEGDEPTILLDPHRIERNVNGYLELRREIARRVGALDYVDLRWQDRISVMPAVHNPLKEGG